MRKPPVAADGFVLSREAHASWYMHGTPLGFFCKPESSMREVFAYYRRVIWIAYWGSLSTSSTLSLVIFGLALPASIQLFGKDGGLSPEATFWMAWGLFAAVFGARLVLAPYWLHRENQAESTKLATNLQSAYEQIADRTAALEDARAQLAEAKIPPSALPQLRIEYEKADHLTRHPSGVVEAKFLIRNDGPGLAKRVRVKVESVVPKARRNKAKILAYASQFAATKLKVVRESLGFELQPGEVAEVKLIRAANDGEWYWVDGYDIDNKESEFRLPRSRYHITVVATSHDGGTDRRVFRVTPKKNGEIDVNLIHPKPVDSNPATQS